MEEVNKVGKGMPYNSTATSINRHSDNPYKSLAIAVIKSAIKENDTRFFENSWCMTLCVLADINYEALCEKVGI